MYLQLVRVQHDARGRLLDLDIDVNLALVRPRLASGEVCEGDGVVDGLDTTVPLSASCSITGCPNILLWEDVPILRHLDQKRRRFAAAMSCWLGFSWSCDHPSATSCSTTLQVLCKALLSIGRNGAKACRIPMKEGRLHVNVACRGPQCRCCPAVLATGDSSYLVLAKPFQAAYRSGIGKYH